MSDKLRSLPIHPAFQTPNPEQEDIPIITATERKVSVSARNQFAVTGRDHAPEVPLPLRSPTSPIMTPLKSPTSTLNITTQSPITPLRSTTSMNGMNAMNQFSPTSPLNITTQSPVTPLRSPKSMNGMNQFSIPERDYIPEVPLPLRSPTSPMNERFPIMFPVPQKQRRQVQRAASSVYPHEAQPTASMSHVMASPVLPKRSFTSPVVPTPGGSSPSPLSRVTTIPKNEPEVERAGSLGSESRHDSAKAEDETTKTEADTMKMDSETTNTDADTMKTESETTNTDADTMKADEETMKTETETTKTDAETMKMEAETTKRKTESTKTNAESMKTETETTEGEPDTTKIDAEETTKTETETTKGEPDTMKTDAEALKTETTKTQAERTDIVKAKEQTPALVTKLEPEKAAKTKSRKWWKFGR